MTTDTHFITDEQTHMIPRLPLISVVYEGRNPPAVVAWKATRRLKIWVPLDSDWIERSDSSENVMFVPCLGSSVQCPF
jgi:hypothetical protein